MNPSGEHQEKFCPTCNGSFPLDVDVCPADGTTLIHLTAGRGGLEGRNIEGRFLIKQRLGSGGMGAVYRAWQGSVGRDVAIKVIESRLSQGVMAAKRFLREAKLTSRLTHPHTVTVLDFGQTKDGLLYLVMELLEGRTLAQVLKQDGAFSGARAIRIGTQLADALDAAHRLSIIHRDLKPSNVVVLNEPPGRDHLKVLDFGLAKSLAGDDDHSTVTKSDAIMGTPAYISPEAVKALPTDARSDLYSLGIMLYELVAGRLPFQATSINQLLMMHAQHPPMPLGPEVSPALGAVIMQLLRKDPAERLQTAAQVRDALQAALSQAAAPADGAGQPAATRAGTSPLPPTATAQPAAVPPTVDAAAGAAQAPAQKWAVTTPHSTARPRSGRGRWIAALLAAVAVVGAAIAALLVGGGGGHQTDSESTSPAAGPTAPTRAVTPGDAAPPALPSAPPPSAPPPSAPPPSAPPPSGPADAGRAPSPHQPRPGSHPRPHKHPPAGSRDRGKPSFDWSGD